MLPKSASIYNANATTVAPLPLHAVEADDNDADADYYADGEQ